MLSLQERGRPLSDYYLVVVDVQDGGDWDWSKGEPPMESPAYYLRFCKTFYRMGGMSDHAVWTTACSSWLFTES